MEEKQFNGMGFSREVDMQFDDFLLVVAQCVGQNFPKH